MTEHDDELATQAAALARAAEALKDDLGATTMLERRTSRAEGDVAKGRRWIRLTIVGLAIDLVLTLFGGYLFSRVDSNTNRINRTQRIVSRDVLCPLYGVFLSSYHPERQKPADLKAYNEAFAVIRKGNATLSCPPARGTPASPTTGIR